MVLMGPIHEINKGGLIKVLNRRILFLRFLYGPGRFPPGTW